MQQLPSFNLVHQNADFIVADKVSGVNFHDEGALGQGLFNQVKQGLSLEELYPVHRLDKLTSGLIVFAKTLAAAQQFQTLFAAHQVEKYYLAISDKKPSKKQGWIKGDMAKSRRGTWKLLRSQQNPAVTQFFSYALGKGERLFLLKPHSGKTHQIRVALSSLGAPILGDPSYAPASNEDRGYLHAYGLRFEFNGESYRFCSAPSTGKSFLSEPLINQLKQLDSPWLLDWPKI
jgi:tRNA pseudouridine32 synthase/23S rRNA pseudouridine746 synthase